MDISVTHFKSIFDNKTDKVSTFKNFDQFEASLYKISEQPRADKKDATLDDLKKYMIDNKSGNLCLPKKLIKLEQIPLLGSGKVDYKKVNENIVN